MAILNNNPLIGSGGQQGYSINNSVRFRSSASAYLSRTPAGAGNRRTWTYSFWAKISTTVTNPTLSVDSASGTDRFHLGFGWINPIEIFDRQGGVNNIVLETTQVFRDPSAWYHCVVAFDTTQATASNRVKIYINGTQVTAFNTATYPSQNYDTLVNAVKLHQIARETSNGSQLNIMDGYMADVYFIDGSQKAASDFGETDTTTGVWKPKAYSGTYGTNGFYLKFSDIATTSGSNAGLGKDFSGNSNYWTTNNISVTSGTTYDAMTDSPTNTSATVANYAVLNPLNQNASVTLTEANLRVTSSGSPSKNVFCTMAVPNTEKIYFEVNVVTGTSTGNFFAVGIAPSTLGLSTEIGSLSGSFSIESDQANLSAKFISGTYTSYGAGTNFAAGNVLQVAIDQANGKIWFGKNNTWFDSGNPSAGTNPATSTLSTTEQYFPGITIYQASGTSPILAFNFGQRPFSYTPPTGFVALNTYNLPTPTILQGNKYMDATLWTGTSANQNIVNVGQFKPDFAWIKIRNTTGFHVLVDSLRVGTGGLSILASNATDAEATTSLSSYVTGFNSNGVALGNQAATSYFTNTSGNTFVGWQWQAGQGSTSSNTSGSITSTVSVNTTAGFSIVTYTGTGANATVGHGLGVAPKMVIVKLRSGAQDWIIWQTALAGTEYLLFTTAAKATAATFWNSTTPTSSVFSIGSSGATNTSSGTYVAYCWAEIAGFSAFGSYTGNGSTDGTFVYTGFRPKYILIKRTNLTEDWYIYDTSRITYNLGNIFIYADLSDAEGTGSTGIDILSNGFKQRQTGGGNNASGSTYIYMAFAENPFKNALAR